MASLSDFSASSLEGEQVQLCQYAGNVVLIVNTASKCGFTPQYKGLQELYRDYSGKGFTVLGFPCNQFLAQEPADEAEISRFCASTYKVTFPMFAKIEVNGPHAHPLYNWLKTAAPGIAGTTAVKWNFTKFLIDRQGKPVVRYAPTMAPSNIAPTIERLLR
ncbi:Hydroperoxy fatty acid reductase gpx1 (plasmid) [Sphingobium sp. AntQ-1]|uniref:glutathione peroxidase n=1 Tax=Sphingobium sp. AntQ-1 TaxID=2930091 RepID=UPI00234EB43A|nr:glutathione peroxidase [Sphingobium sp. AntQ-1]WCP16290.1 Hydroperoxy fatty acid reductase gpx1 [Sphingobium sp. AntQ-1]